MNEWRQFARLFDVVRYPYRKHLIIFILMCAMVAPPVLEAIIIQQIIDHAILEQNLEWLGWMLLAFMLVNVTEGALTILEGFLTASFGPKLVFELRHKFYRHVQRLEYGFFSRTPNGEIVSRLMNDIGTLENFLLRSLPSFTRNILTVIVMVGVLFTFSWQVSLIVVPLAFAFHMLYSIREDELEDLSRKNQEYTASFQSFFAENVSLAHLIRIFGLERNRLRKHARLTKHYIRNYARFVLLYRFVDQFAESVPLATNLVIYGLGGYLIMSGEMTLGTLMAFTHLFGLLIEPLGGIFGVNIELKTLLPSVKRLFEYFDMPVEPDGDLRLKRPVETVRLEDVTFSYDSEPVLDRISATFQRGQHVAIVGPSGSGKTTLAALLMRLYRCNQGMIYINDKAITELKGVDLTRAVTYVPQETTLFNASIEENLRLGNETASTATIENAAKYADIHEFISQLPDGYSTIVGERGMRLSGGQRQRLAIARAILRQPDVLVLDEATSHLDSESEAKIQNALSEVTAEMITITIAHRYSTIVDSDMILVLEAGRIVEQGTHQQLLSMDGRYRRLWDLQNLDA